MVSNKLAKAKKVEDDFKAAFQSLAFEESSEMEGDEEVYFYLWENLEEVVSVYRTLTNYLSEYYAIDTAVLLALVKDKCMPVERTLQLIPYIHSGYLDIIVDKAEDNGGHDYQDT
jgi:hypothetical protein